MGIDWPLVHEKPRARVFDSTASGRVSRLGESERTKTTTITARRLHRGDVAITRFLAAAELIETDLWQQYKELALGNPAFGEALGVLDEAT